MEKESWKLALVFVFLLSGCVVRTYSLTKDRVDQDLSAGNRGYLQGEGSAGELKDKKTTRTTRVVEIELHPPIKFEGAPKTVIPEAEPAPRVREIEEIEEPAIGNRGYITRNIIPETAQAPMPFEKYTVKKNDTLQKISQKFYGTSKKWAKIYEANKDALAGPNKLYPGQVLDIPASPELKAAGSALKEPKENLK